MGTEERLKEKIGNMADDLKVIVGYAKSDKPLRVIHCL